MRNAIQYKKANNEKFVNYWLEGGILLNKNILAISIAILFLGVAVAPSTAIDIVEKTVMPTNRNRTLYVGGNGTGNYTTIQEAINDANSGDTVFVYDDSSPYKENVIVNRSINFIGEDKDTTVIDANETGKHAIKITVDNVTSQNYLMMYNKDIK